MRRLGLGLAALSCCAATGDASPIATWAGRYDRSFVFVQNGVNGVVTARDRLSDILEVVPVSSNAAYISIVTIGHVEDACSISGVAQVEGSRLVYRDRTRPRASDAACTIAIARVGRSLRIYDGLDEAGLESGCAQMYCGANGGFSVTLPQSSRRSITYLARLKSSPEYRDALAKWRAR
jgi:hypothetical protein